VNRGLPKLDLTPRPKHALRLIDLAVIAGIFYLAGMLYMDTKGEERLNTARAEREKAHVEAERALAQADSVVSATERTLQAMLADSASTADSLVHRRAALEAAMAESERLSQALFPLGDQVAEMRRQAAEARRKTDVLRKDAAQRQAEVGKLRGEVQTLTAELEAARQRREQAAATVAAATRAREYEPASIFPDKSAVAVGRQVATDEDLTSVEVQRTMWDRGPVDVGLSLGLGLGSGDASSMKKAGLLLSRPLIHRRLAMDFQAGLSTLGDEEGNQEGTAYASAGLRVSPFYRERLHFGLGARADERGVQPYLGIVFGRR
jgi:hypothetical protein